MCYLCVHEHTYMCAGSWAVEQESTCSKTQGSSSSSEDFLCLTQRALVTLPCHHNCILVLLLTQELS